MSTVPAPLERLRSNPVPLLAWAMIAIVVVGLAHLIVDIIVWDGDGFLSELDGIVNDGLAIVEGIAVTAAALAVVVARGGAYPARLEPVRSVLTKWLEGSSTKLPLFAWFVAYLGVIHLMLALWDDRGGPILFLLSRTAHDLALTALVAAVVIGLVAIATERAGVRLDVLGWFAVGVPVGSLAHAFLTLFGGDDSGREFEEAFPELMFDLLQTAAVTTVVLALLVVVCRSSRRSPSEVLSWLPEPLRDPLRIIRITGIAAIVFGVLLVATRLAEADGGGDVTMFVLSTSVRDAVVFIGLAAVASTVRSNEGDAADGEEGDAPSPDSLPWFIAVAAVAGVLGALFSLGAYSDFYDDGQRLYWLLNQLLRTALGVAVLLLSAALLRPPARVSEPATDSS